jgi:ComF family protein
VKILLARALRGLHALAGALASLPLGWVAPPTCAACDEDVPPGRVLCSPCAATVSRSPLAPHGPAGAVAAFVYGGAIATTLRRYKYGGRPDLARPLGHLLRAAARDAVLSPDLVVPVPLHPRRRAERGFDQVALLAVEVARELRRPYRPSAARRLRHGPPQASLGQAERLRSETLRFSADPRLCAGRVVLLVDDVVTTGATLRACRDALFTAGARRVDTLCLARAEATSAEDAALARSSAGHHAGQDGDVIREAGERAGLPEGRRPRHVHQAQRG